MSYSFKTSQTSENIKGILWLPKIFHMKYQAVFHRNKSAHATSFPLKSQIENYH